MQKMSLLRHKRNIVVITGTPGTGKTRLAKAFVKKGYSLIDIKKLVQQKKIPRGYDKKRECWTVNPKQMTRVVLALIKDINGSVVIEGHLSHYLPAKHVTQCIITQCNLKTLSQRLKKRGYPKAKIDENLESEIMEVILTEARELGHKLKIVKTG